MLGFRQTFNLSIDQGGNGSELQCDDDVGSSAILVRRMYTPLFPSIHKLFGFSDRLFNAMPYYPLPGQGRAR